MIKRKSAAKLPPSKLNALPGAPTLSVCIPAYNEEENIGPAIEAFAAALINANIPYEFVIANDNSKDGTQEAIQAKMEQGYPIRLINRTPPGGFGRAVRTCFEHVAGDIVAVVMADLSDDPNDLVKCYHKINEGYDAVFGSRFIEGATVKDYPRIKLLANRLGNFMLQVMFRTHHNDLTNAFKVYRSDALRTIMPFYASHFNLTIEVSLGLMVRNFRIATVPVNWYGRTWGQANFKIRELGRRYLATMLKLYAEWIFIRDDLMAEHGRSIKEINRSELREQVLSNIGEMPEESAVGE